MKKFFLSIFILIGLGSLSAQTFVGKIYHQFSENRILFGPSDTLKILAVMVEFQQDDDPNTVGTGKFGSVYTQAYGDTILDPLPHDANYFASHLEFAKNYFSKVSGGKLNIAYQILPQIITVSQTMRNYSPPPQNASDFTNMGKFAQEVWQIAATTFSDIDFSKYNLFTILYAGVGKDVLLPGSLGNERDLPSVYMGEKSFKNIFGNNFNGFPVNGGSFLIKNTMFIPCTESREQDLIGGGKLLNQFTINGVIVGNIASHLGLPDLFNTSTGVSAISRFGLMDTDALLAYSGIFPPEPSAWEKIYLGWIQPVTLSVGDNRVNLAAKIAAALTDTTILKIPINSSEYFLIENRERDAKKDGLNLTYKLHNQSYSFKIDKDKGRFQWYGVDTLHGVITDADEFDWAVPGSGIVIWHVDENIINNKIADNQINADSKHKGVYVEEADGIFDIGVKFVSVLGTDYGRGTEEDLWYAGNPATLYKNIFGPDTKPNTNSNSGANSLITMDNFSAISNKMSFNISFNNGNVKLISSNHLNLGQLKKIFASNGLSTLNYLYVTENSNLNKYDIHGLLIKTLQNFTEVQPVAFNYNGAEYLIGAKGQLLNIYSITSQKETLQTIDVLSTITLLAVDKVTSLIPKVLIGTTTGYLFAVQADVLPGINQFIPNNYAAYKGNDSIINIGIDNNYYAILQPRSLIEHSDHDFVLQLTSNSKKVTLTKDTNGKYKSVVLLDGNNFIIVNEGNIVSSFQVKSQSTINSFAVADLFNDGQNYILISDGNLLEAYNFEGVSANHFPFAEPNGENFIGTPLAMDLNREGFADVIAYTDKGNIYAINPTTGKVIDAFPISSGAQNAVTPVLFGENLPTMGPIPVYKPYLAVLDQTNNMYVWNIAPTLGKFYWSSEFGDAVNSSFVTAPSNILQITDFFPLDKAYNWPNPVYGSETKIRYYVTESANVKIKIFDLSGDLVADIDDRANGGFDNETTWNVAKIQSGIYYAHIQVNGDSGKSASKIIKIAVIK